MRVVGSTAGTGLECGVGSSDLSLVVYVVGLVGGSEMVLGSVVGTWLMFGIGSSVGPMLVRRGPTVGTVKEGLEGR